MDRTRKERKSPGVIQNIEHHDPSGTKKVSTSGITIGDIFGTDSATAQLVGERRMLMVTNLDTVTQYIGTGDSSIAAPTVSTGVAIPSGATIYINTGSDNYFRTSSNTVQVIAASV